MNELKWKAARGEVLAFCAALMSCTTTTQAPCPPAALPEFPEVPPAADSGNEPGIVFRSEMSASFVMMRVLLVLDHQVLYNSEVASTREPAPHFVLMSKVAQTPGPHLLQVLVQMRGHGEGQYSYLGGYKFEVKSSHQFTVQQNRATRVEVVAWEKGGPMTPLEQRPAVRYIERSWTRLEAPHVD